MEAPQIEGYKINTQIGSGSAGVVYLATRENGSRCAIKVLGGMSSNPGLMSDRIQRVFEADAQGVIVPITARELEARPAWVIMDFLSESEEAENPVISRTLQSALNQYLQNDSTWPFLQNLASALAKLHSASVAHGNLKPGNVFFGQGGSPLLADFASGCRGFFRGYNRAEESALGPVFCFVHQGYDGCSTAPKQDCADGNAF